MIESTSGFVKIAGNLKVHPELRCCFQDTGKQNSGFSSHVSLAIDQRIDSLNGNTHSSGKFDLAQSKRFQEFLEKDLSRMRWFSVFRNHCVTFSDSQ